MSAVRSAAGVLLATLACAGAVTFFAPAGSAADEAGPWENQEEGWIALPPSEWFEQPDEGDLRYNGPGQVTGVWGCIVWIALSQHEAWRNGLLARMGEGPENISKQCGYLDVFPYGPPPGAPTPPGEIWTCTPGLNALIYSVPWNRGECGFNSPDSLGDFGSFVPTVAQIAGADRYAAALRKVAGVPEPEATESLCGAGSDPQVLCAHAEIDVGEIGPGGCTSNGLGGNEDTLHKLWYATPILGGVMAVHDAVTGKEGFTNRCLSSLERGFAAVTIIPSLLGAFGLGSVLGRGALRALSRYRADRIAQTAERAGFTRGLVRGLSEIAKKHDVIIELTSSNKAGSQLIENGEAVAKWALVKTKSFNELDDMILGGGRSDLTGKVVHTDYAKAVDEVWGGYDNFVQQTKAMGRPEAVQQYWKRVEEYYAYNQRYTKAVSKGGLQIDERGVVNQLTKAADGTTSFRPAASDPDIYRIVNPDGSPVSAEKAAKIFADTHAQGLTTHGQLVDINKANPLNQLLFDEITRAHAPGGNPLLKIDPSGGVSLTHTLIDTGAGI